MFRAAHYSTSSICTTTSERLLACTGEPTCSCVQGKLNQKRRKNVDVSLLKNYEAIINNNDFTKTPDDSAKPGCRLARWVGIIMFSHMYGPWPISELCALSFGRSTTFLNFTPDAEKGDLLWSWQNRAQIQKRHLEVCRIQKGYLKIYQQVHTSPLVLNDQ